MKRPIDEPFAALDDDAIDDADIDELRTAYRALREHHSEIVKARLADLKAQRRRYSGEVPYGYTDVDGNLVEEPTEQRVIALVLELHRKGKGLRAIARELHQANFRPRTGAGSAFQHVQVRRILNRVHDDPIPGHGTQHPSVPSKSTT